MSKISEKELYLLNAKCKMVLNKFYATNPTDVIIKHKILTKSINKKLDFIKDSLFVGIVIFAVIVFFKLLTLMF